MSTTQVVLLFAVAAIAWVIVVGICAELFYRAPLRRDRRPL